MDSAEGNRFDFAGRNVTQGGWPDHMAARSTGERGGLVIRGRIRLRRARARVRGRGTAPPWFESAHQRLRACHAGAWCADHADHVGIDSGQGVPLAGGIVGLAHRADSRGGGGRGQNHCAPGALPHALFLPERRPGLVRCRGADSRSHHGHARRGGQGAPRGHRGFAI